VSDRRDPRFPLKIEVEYRTAAAFLVAYSANLSKGGLFLETDEALPQGTRLAVRVVVPGHGPTIEGEVAWVRTREQGTPGVGVRFLDRASEELGQVIDSLVVGFKGVRVVVFASRHGPRGKIIRMVRSMMSNALVVEVASKREGENALGAEHDLAVIDLDDALSDGLGIVRAAKQRPQGPIPVIALAADGVGRVRARDAGADGVVANPPGSHEFQEAIIAALAKPSRVGR